MPPSTVLWSPATCVGLAWPGDHVVGQDAGQQIRVGLELLDRGRVELREGVVGRCEDGEPGPLLRVSTRFTFGLSLPDSAEVSVVSIGLLDAATATGSCAMPVTEPGPVGTFSAYPAQPVPTRSAAGSAMVLAIAGADELAIDARRGSGRGCWRPPAKTSSNTRKRRESRQRSGSRGDRLSVT